MTSLLLKDFIIIWKQAKFMLVLTILYIIIGAVSNNYFFSMFSVFFLAILPLTTMGLDERSKWEQYAITMPFSRKELVLSRYILSILGILVALIIFMVSFKIINIFTNQAMSFQDLLYMILPMIALSLTFIAINLPICFKIGVEKGRLGFLILGAAFFGAISGLLALDLINVEMLTGSRLAIPIWLFFCGSVVAVIISILISFKIYNKREF